MKDDMMDIIEKISEMCNHVIADNTAKQTKQIRENEIYKNKYFDLITTIEAEHSSALAHLEEVRNVNGLTVNVIEQEGYLRAMHYLLDVINFDRENN